MNDLDPDILVRRFVDDDLSAPETRRALHRIADDPEARELLRFELQMTQDLAASSSAEPPPDFAERTMATLAEAPASASASSFRERLEAWWHAIAAPVALEVRPLTVALGAVLLGAGAWLAGPLVPSGPGPGGTAPTARAPSSEAAPSVQRASTPASRNGSTVWIRFMYTNNTADSVAVAGDFSQWSPIPLSPRTVNGETVWTGLVPVSRGEHEYQFVINGERWVPDPLAPVTRSDGFGARNAVLDI